MKHVLILSVILCLANVKVTFANLGTSSEKGIHPFISVYNGVNLQEKLDFPMQNGKLMSMNKMEWSLSVNEKKVDEDPNAIDYVLTWRLEKGKAHGICVGVDFVFQDWSIDNYVFIPAIVYNNTSVNFYR